MAYICPRCGKPVQRGTTQSSMGGGVVGMLLSTAFGGFECKECGKVPLAEFSDEDRSKMIAGSAFMVIGAVVLAVAVIFLIKSIR